MSCRYCTSLRFWAYVIAFAPGYSPDDNFRASVWPRRHLACLRMKKVALTMILVTVVIINVVVVVVVAVWVIVVAVVVVYITMIWTGEHTRDQSN